ncbi:MFS transporter [Streptomyces sp. NBC_01808]|uniref:MFS transporter n=1 Tax=Streptomyces sp. NBC_01808 TaxID=2975947 RepID=UPI002DD94B31|nr:MFS transporter [Streptomyces sp. NBC_01808]WSA42492.1 MFS transporter [Streptomyces sp. NBC_01808]
MFSVLRNRTYRHLFAAQVIALVGTGLATVALSLLAYDLAGGNASAVLGTALAVKMVAYVGIAPVIGALGDRIPRRALLVAADLVRGVVALALPFVTEVWQIYVLIFLLQSASAAFTPTFQATIPEVLPAERDYTRALSLSRLAYDMESLFSPVLAAGLLTLLTYDRLFLGTAAGFVASAALVVSVALPKPTPRETGGEGGTESGGVFARAAYGIRLFGSAPRLRALLALNFAVAAASSMVIVNTVVLVRDHFARPVGDVSLALGAYGAGSMAVALALPRVLERVGDRAVMLPAAFVPAPVLAVVGAGLAAGVRTWPALLAAWAVLGAATSAMVTPTGRLIRGAVPGKADLPAAFAAQFSLSHVAWLLTYPLAGYLAARAGTGVAAGALAVIGLAAAVAAVLLWRPAGAARTAGPYLPARGARLTRDRTTTAA